PFDIPGRKKSTVRESLQGIRKGWESRETEWESESEQSLRTQYSSTADREHQILLRITSETSSHDPVLCASRIPADTNSTINVAFVHRGVISQRINYLNVVAQP